MHRGCLVCGEIGSCEEKFFKIGWGDAACCESPAEDSSGDSVIIEQEKDYTKDVVDDFTDVCDPNPCR